MDLRLGMFVVPDATTAASTVGRIIEAERSGLGIVGVQGADVATDRPFRRRLVAKPGRALLAP
jgi:hypothetical protein